MKRPTVAALMAEIEALRKRVAELEARPPVVIHNHQPMTPLPSMPPVWAPPGLPYKFGDIWCGISVAHSSPTDLTWNGGGSSCITANGGDSGGSSPSTP